MRVGAAVETALLSQFWHRLLQQAGNLLVVTGFTLTNVDMQFQTALTDLTAFSPVTSL